MQSLRRQCPGSRQSRLAHESLGRAGTQFARAPARGWCPTQRQAKARKGFVARSRAQRTSQPAEADGTDVTNCRRAQQPRARGLSPRCRRDTLRPRRTSLRSLLRCVRNVWGDDRARPSGAVLPGEAGFGAAGVRARPAIDVQVMMLRLYTIAMDVTVSTLRAELADWIKRVRAGEEVVVTDRGMPVVRLVAVDTAPLLEQLTRQGVVSRSRRPGRPTASGARRVRARGPVSDLVSEQRR
jgi:prevent-host-death family protein